MDRIDKKNVEFHIDRLVADGRNKLAVYPYGEIGRYSEEYLYRRYGIKIVYAIDNKQSDGVHVISLDEINPENDILYLICSSSPKFYEEIRREIYSRVDKSNVIDLFAYDNNSKWYKAHQNLAMRSAIWDAAYDNDSRIQNAKYTAGFWKKKFIHLEIDDIFAGDIAAGRDYPYFRYGIHQQDDIKALYYNGQFTEEEKDDYISAVDMGLICRNPGVHATAAYERIIQEGIQPSLELVKKKLKSAEGIDIGFYRAEEIVLDGFRELILRYAFEAQKLYEETRRDNLKEIADNCMILAKGVPQNFSQGLQLVLFVHLGIVMENGCGSFSFGRLDQYLYPLYKKDVENGNITPDEAQKYIIAFWRKLAEMEFGWQNITIGGARRGIAEENELTRMCLEAAREVGDQQPQLSLRIHDNTPYEIWEDAIDLISHGMGFPALFNDNKCKEAMKNKGFSDEDSENYSVMGCVELLSGGNEFSHQEGLRLNFVKLLELLLHNGLCSLTGKKWRLKQEKNLDSIQSVDELIEWYEDELEDTVRRLCRMLDLTSKHYAMRYHAPFLSAMMNGPLEKGKDIHDNGTKYNNLTICGVGTGEIADCLQAIQIMCFERKRLTLSELRDVLDRDFEENEDIRSELQNCDKYGNDIDDVDYKCKKIIDVVIKTISAYELQYRDGIVQAGFYTSYFHADFGKMTGASPDGRKKGMPLSPSLSPMAGMDRNGILAVINSANKIDMSCFGNSMALDLKLSPVFFDKDENREALISAVKTYFDRGGVEIQFNVVDAETLRKAKSDPINYRNIIVRVAGFSARFVELDNALQDEIIRRTEHICA